MDDRRRAKRFMTDDDRAAIGRARRTPTQGVPEQLDQRLDLTPAPQLPPIAGTVEQRLDLLADGLASVTGGLGRLWDNRDNGERLDRLDGKIDGLQKSLGVWSDESIRHSERIKQLCSASSTAINWAEAAKDSQLKTEAKLDRITDLFERNEGMLRGIAETLKDVVTRMGRLENIVDRLSTNHSALEARVEATAKMQNAMDVRLTAIERAQREGALVKSTAEEVHKKWFTWTRAALVGGGGLVTMIAKELGLLG